MPRLKRLFVAGQPLHVIQRGVDRQAVFFADEDRKRYCQWLVEAAETSGARVHAWVLMTNHVHLLVTPDTPQSVPRAMQMLGRRYVRYINYMSGRTGPLWEGRYRSAPVDGDAYFLACCRYIELNPVRARMVVHPGDYRWSSYRAHAQGAADLLAVPHEHYEALGDDAMARQANYRELFRQSPDEQFIATLRRATNGGWAVGGERFRAQVEAVAQRRAAPLPRGRKLEMGSG